MRYLPRLLAVLVLVIPATGCRAVLREATMHEFRATIRTCDNQPLEGASLTIVPAVHATTGTDGVGVLRYPPHASEDIGLLMIQHPDHGWSSRRIRLSSTSGDVLVCDWVPADAMPTS